jgi:hypothetical protein
MFTGIKHLENLNDFPKVGLIFLENSGENLLRYYLERILSIKTGCNIKKEYLQFSNQKSQVKNLFDFNENLQNNWIISSDYPHRDKSEYNSVQIASAILLIRNPVDLIMSKLFKDFQYLEDALSKIDNLIEDWKTFYKYWTDCPIPVHIIRYEDLVEDPSEIMKHLCKFLLGIKSIENTKMEFTINQSTKEKVESHYLAYDVNFEDKNSTGKFLSEKNIQNIQAKFYGKLEKVLKKFNYEVNANGEASTWMADFNTDSLVKSVDFHEFINCQYMTAIYSNVKIG